VFDIGRTDLLACPAGGAGPDNILADFCSEYVVFIAEGRFTYLLDDLHGGERFAGVPCRALVLASPATGAGIRIEYILPGKVGDPGCAILTDALIFQIDGSNRTLRSEIGELIVGGDGEDMAQFGKWYKSIAKRPNRYMGTTTPCPTFQYISLVASMTKPQTGHVTGKYLPTILHLPPLKNPLFAPSP
jgi:hypothetical protein